MLVEFTKDGRPELKILDPLYVYGDDGNYTEDPSLDDSSDNSQDDTSWEDNTDDAEQME